MTIEKIARCLTCTDLAFCDKDTLCEWCTGTTVYATGMVTAIQTEQDAPVSDLPEVA
jgi:hypothetical protein